MSGQKDSLRQIAARIIQTAWRRFVYREVFRYFKELIGHCNQRDPQAVLKTVNPREAELLDGAAGIFIRFRLGGDTFPPNIYYKIFTYRPITDLCANSPKDYTKRDLKRPVVQQTHNDRLSMQEDRSGWYERSENNSWRLFCCKVAPMTELVEIGADKKKDFHPSRLQRQQDVNKWRKRRKMEWLKQMYKQGRVQPHVAQQHTASQVRNSAKEVMDTTEEKGDDEALEWELDELLAWTNAFSFDDYIEDWKCLACSHSPQFCKDVPSCSTRLHRH